MRWIDSSGRADARAAPIVSFLRKAKQNLLGVAERLGALDAAAATQWRKERLLILCYHGVSISDEHEWDGALYVSPHHLRQRFALLRDDGYNVLSLDEGLRRLHNASLPERSVALTFDDGTHDFAVRVQPLLREFGYHATVYLTTYYCLHQYPVFNTAGRYLLWKARTRELRVDGLLPGGGSRPIGTPEERVRTFEEFRRLGATRPMNGHDWQELLLLIADRLKVSLERINGERMMHVMSPEDVASLSPEHVAVELHTHRHRVPLDRVAFTREIEENRRIIADLTSGRSARHFCYPSGVTHSCFLTWLRELGVHSATTGTPDLASRRSERLLLPRFVDTSTTSEAEFKGWLSGVASLLPKRRERRFASGGGAEET